MASIAGTQAHDPVIDVRGLTKTYSTGFQALKGIDLSIRRGEIFALLGPNGAGKTTLISIVCGIVNATAGRVRVDGHDIAALVALVGVNASMIGFGWMQERYVAPGGGLGPFWIGCVAGSVPWIAIGIYLAGPGADQHAPGFVYAIFFSLFVLFNCFAVNQWLQYRRRGRFADYLYGEQVYLVLSLVAKSLLAWQIYGGSLAN